MELERGSPMLVERCICELCKKAFFSPASEYHLNQRKEEMKKYFGELPKEKQSTVCNGCYTILMGQAKEKGLL